MTFPTDDVTLTMLRESCRPLDDGRSHLFDFLKMGARVHEVIDRGDVDEVVYEPGRAPYTVQQVIVALVTEIEQSRRAVP